MRLCNLQPLLLQLRAVGVIAIDGIVPAFDVQVGIVTDADEGMDDLRPVGIPQAGKAMLRHAGMANAVLGEQRAIDARILGVNVKNA